MDSRYDVLVIGAGIAGLTAAGQAARNGLSTGCIETLMFGGLIANINEIDGEPSGSGADLASSLVMENSDLGVNHLTQTVTAISRAGDCLSVTTDAGTHRARAVIIASGARLRHLGIPGEAEFESKGVAHCADCDGPFYRNQDVAVVGGGDAALQEALVLARFARRVHLIHRGAQFGARTHFSDAVARQDNILPVLNTVAEQILGDDMVTGVRVRNVSTNDTRTIACAGIFAYIGLEPACEFAPREIERGPDGRLVTNDAMQTTMPGVYAAGAVRTGYRGQLRDAIAEGSAAARAAHAALSG